MGAGGVVIRGEQWQMAYQDEETCGTDPGTSGYTRVFGVVQTATMPDPVITFHPFWGQGTSSARNWYTAYLGRIDLTGSIPDIVLLNGRPLVYPIGTVGTTSTASGYYTHTITEAVTLKSFALHTTYVGSDGSIQLMRRFLGGKVNRATIEASEGDFLKMSLDDISFINFTHNQSGETYYSSGVSGLIAPEYPTNEPYLFSYGSLSLNSTVFARIKNFRLSISNNLEPKFYVTTSSHNTRLPYEVREGRREYQLTCTVDIEDASLFRELVRLGTYTNTFKGFQTIITFTRATNDSITLTMPATTPAGGGDAIGCLVQNAPHNIVQDPIVSVPLTIITRNLSISVVDTLWTYP